MASGKKKSKAQRGRRDEKKLQNRQRKLRSKLRKEAADPNLIFTETALAESNAN